MVRNVVMKLATTLFGIGCAAPVFSQADGNQTGNNLERAGGQWQVHASFSFLQDARIRQTTGDYRVKANRHIAAAAGADNSFSVDGYRLSFSYGLGVVMVHHNYYLVIPGADLPAYPGTGGAPQIQNKEIFFRLSLPAQLRLALGQNPKTSLAAFAGGAINYSGFSSDSPVGFHLMTATGQWPIEIGRAVTKSNNGGKPWLSLIAGLSKPFLVNRDGRLAVELKAEWTGTDFLRTGYTVTVPGKPVSEGSVVVTGASVGIGLRYFFNKALPVVKERQ